MSDVTDLSVANVFGKERPARFRDERRFSEASPPSFLRNFGAASRTRNRSRRANARRAPGRTRNRWRRAERVAALPRGRPDATTARSAVARPAGLEPATPGLED